jgi:hypothetical protein
MYKLYVVVRRDLSKSQQAVQAGHALAQFLIDCPNSGWTNGTLVYLKGPNGHDEMMSFFKNISEIGSVWHVPFYEPDLDNEITALAILGCEDIIPNVLLGLPLV